MIFTGGILPTLWRPVSAIGAFDQPTYKVDLTPFVPLLADGKPHVITLDVASAEVDHSILGNWYLSGNIQVVKDHSSKPTTGSILSYSAPLYATTSITGIVTPAADGSNNVNITVDATHKLEITSKVVTGSGKTNIVTWTQSLSYSNFQSFLDDANTQVGTHHSGLMVSYNILTPSPRLCINLPLERPFQPITVFLQVCLLICFSSPPSN